MNNRDRTNPFRSPNRVNFPPLDEFFESNTNSSTAEATAAEENSFTNSPEQSFSSRNSACWNDFSMDMSIGGRAAMAQHRHYVAKHGIDGAEAEEEGGSPTDSVGMSGAEKSSSLSEGDDWDRFMDDSYSLVSFSSTAILAARKSVDEGNLSRIGRVLSESPEDSYADDASSSFFDKSTVRVLMTPEKIRTQAVPKPDAELGTNDVTVQRGRDHAFSESLIDQSVDCDTNISSNCSGVEGMLHAALRFHDDFDLQSSFNPEDEPSFAAGKSSSTKNASVSFAADTSFVTHDNRYGSRRKQQQQQARILENELEGEKLPNGEFNFLFGSPIRKSNEKDGSFCGDSSFLASPIVSPAFSRVNSEISKVSSPSSPLVNSPPRRKPSPDRSVTPIRSGRRSHAMKTHHSTNLSFIGLSPIDTQMGGIPLERCSRSVSLPLEFDDNMKKKLFDDEPDHTTMHFAISHDCIEVLPKKMCGESGNDSTVKLEESYFSESSASQSRSEEHINPIRHSREFGTNSASRLNSMYNNPLLPKRQAWGSMRQSAESPNRLNICEESRRGVRLSRASKLKELGLERACSLPENYRGRKDDF
eukprot:CAMPEP_0171434054 /NCGR_PEP_ID=MMETSP0881-20121228/8928_1 /TAXON_ID=67004 /ORGANISM="Thalassiosira weissflogii, Strain CCMP1336" /LENGTH=587 /DNA_ID=CAMNT_0011954705 /DNA_START=278 /DNA_END=2041 /DNA_ORIENTATION=+